MTYSSSELSTLAAAPMMAGLAVALADFGVVSTAIEATAMSKEIASAAQKYPNNSVIQSVFAEEVIRSGAVQLEKPQVTPEDVQSGAVVDQAIASIQSALAALNGKATDAEIAEYKQLIYTAAEAVANAAGSGLFGSGKTKVSVEEADALSKLKAALAL
ncbi:hypothetical protein ACQ4M4_00315 [Leptolyngbya sp. AN02str]|uniref:hypothetical protein n=1 Tax=Leptolyngbya sp. AN02str TaxID=3423363 RepID=UPI003D311058